MTRFNAAFDEYQAAPRSDDAESWREALERHLRDELTESEMERLAEWLVSDPASRQSFVEEALWDTRMAEAMRGCGVDETPEPLTVRAGTDLDPQKSAHSTLRFLLAGAVAVIAAGFNAS